MEHLPKRINYQPGDILRVFRLTKMVNHYGIITNRGTVIDLTLKGVCERSFDDFARSGKVICINPEDDVTERRIILNRAYSVLKRKLKVPYHLFKQNCEHFVTWCKTGKPVSHQVTFVAVTGLSILVIMSLWFWNKSNRNNE